MQKLIFLSGLVVVLAAIASAAPIAEEVSELRTPNIKQLLAEANPDDNDIAAPITDAPLTDEGTRSTAVSEDPPAQNTEVVADVTEEDVAVPVTPTAASPVETVIVEVPVIEKQTESSNKTDIVDEKKEPADGGDLIPVTEVIPPPKVAFVLGVDDESIMNQDTVDENINNYQIVQGENEQGTQFLSEFVPTSPSSQVEEASGVPIAEQIRYEYPSEDIRPGSAFRPDQAPDTTIPSNLFNGDAQYDDYNPGPHINPDFIDELIEHEMMNSGMNFHPMNEGPVSHDYQTHPDYVHDYSTDYMSNADHPTETHFSGFNAPMDFSDGFPIKSFDESVNYDTQSSLSEDDIREQSPIGEEESPIGEQQSPIGDQQLPLGEEQSVMPDETAETESESAKNSFLDGIVAGLHENYHPEPISGMMHQPEGTLPDADYHVYDEPIIPAAMINVETPAVEEANFEDDIPRPHMPQIPEMVEFPQPVAEFPVQNAPMASMQPMDHDDMMDNDVFPSDSNNEIGNDDVISEPSVNDSVDKAVDSFEAEPATNNQGVLIIKLDIPSQEAHVNGKPFMMESSSNILSFIEHLLRNAMMSSNMPTNDNIPNGFVPDSTYMSSNMPTNDNIPNGFLPDSTHNADERFHPEMSMPQEPGHFFDDLPFMYPQYNVPDFFYPTTYNYNPYNPFLSGLRRRRMIARQNRMSSFNDRSDYDSMPYNNQYNDQYLDQYDAPYNGQYYDQYNGYGPVYNPYW